MSRCLSVGGLAAALLLSLGVNLASAAVPCVCPLWPIDQYIGEDGRLYYLYYAESYAEDDYECLYPYVTWYVDTPDIPWPFICDDCIPASGPGGMSASQFFAERKTAIAYAGLPEKVAVDYSPQFPKSAPEASSGAETIHQEFAEFVNPDTGNSHRVKLFTIKVSPQKAGRKGSERMLGVGYEVVEDKRSTPTIRLPSKFAKKLPPNGVKSEDALETVYRLHVGAMQYTVFLAKSAAEGQRLKPEPIPVSRASVKP